MELKGEVTLEFYSLADFYNYFAISPTGNTSETPIPLSFTLTQPTAITGSTYPSFQLIMPSVYFDGESPMVTTPGMIQAKAAFSVLDDGTHNALQLTYVTPDNNLSPSNF
jgi:hypothetical protein